ncbi:MAG: hypothetical protein PWQ55_1448 [Chloroflexota bacterium]|nr:hypothetical protein [Chloroflexota bacterium]
MPSNTNQAIPEQKLPCTVAANPACAGCATHNRLMCRYTNRDLLNFFTIVFPYALAVIVGAILGGYGRYLFLWLAYSLFFFFVWEARVLCRHCPYWAGSDRILECHANSGVFKIWKFDPAPMSASEKKQFIAGALLWLVFPFPLLLLGGQNWLAFIGFCSAACGVLLLRYNVCSRCVNLSCPLNNVPKELVDAYLEINPTMKKAWLESGYTPGSQDR